MNTQKQNLYKCQKCDYIFGRRWSPAQVEYPCPKCNELAKAARASDGKEITDDKELAQSNKVDG